MAVDYKLKINGVDMPNPMSLEIGPNPIGVYFRLLNASMLIKGIAGKLKVTAKWDFISYADAKIVWDNTYGIFKQTLKQDQDLGFMLFGELETIHTYFSPYKLLETTESQAAGGYSGLTIDFPEM